MKTLSFTLDDTDRMTVGFMLDIIFEKAIENQKVKDVQSKQHKKRNKIKIRWATQKDMDRLANIR